MSTCFISSAYRALWAASFGLWVIGAAAAESSAPTITPLHQVAEAQGREVTVSFYVRSTGYNPNGNYQELYSSFAWDQPENLFVRLTPQAQRQMEAVGVYQGAGHFSGRIVQVRGVVQQVVFGEVKRPAIYVESLDQITVQRAEEYRLPESAYEKVSVGDFVLKISPRLTKNHPQERQQIIDELSKQFTKIKAVLPVTSYETLKGAVFIINWDAMQVGAAYHPDLKFLRGAGVPDYYHKTVEIRNAKRFLGSTRLVQPWVALHELAHKYHHEHLGLKRTDVLESFQSAKKKGSYEKIKHVNGREERAYAMANDREYFAELTESYFGKNDFFPFNREELAKHDPQGYQMIEACWGAIQAK